MATSTIARNPRVGSNLPENVVWLPTAAKRKPGNYRYAAQREPTMALREAHAARFGYKLPFWRAEEARKQKLSELGVRRSPEMCIALAILDALPDDMKRKARLTVLAVGAVDQTEGAQGAALLLEDYWS
jgi:hypothetical protein